MLISDLFFISMTDNIDAENYKVDLNKIAIFRWKYEHNIINIRLKEESMSKDKRVCGLINVTK